MDACVSASERTADLGHRYTPDEVEHLLIDVSRHVWHLAPFQQERLGRLLGTLRDNVMGWTPIRLDRETARIVEPFVND